MIDFTAGPVYRLFVPKQAVGANLIYFDLFNASGSARRLLVHSVYPIVSGAVAVVGSLGVDLFLNRTSAVGTGGTAATQGGTAFDAATFSPVAAGNPAVSASVTARLTPTGGATAGAAIAMASVFTEETAVAAYWAYLNDFVSRGRPDMPPVFVNEGSGISVVQGSVASVGNIAFDVVFQLVSK